MGARTSVPAVRALLVALAAAALVVPLGACGDDDGTTTDGTATPTSTAVGATTPGDSPTGTTSGTADLGEGIDPMLDAGLEPVAVDADGRGTAYLTEVDVARHEGYDRVVFHFEDARPGATVGYVEPPLRADGSGLEVAVDGAAALEVRLEPASVVDLSSATVREVYTGPDRIAPDTPTIAEVVQVGDFEGVARWAIGVRDRAAFRVLVLEGPSRIVVDVANH